MDGLEDEDEIHAGRPQENQDETDMPLRNSLHSHEGYTWRLGGGQGVQNFCKDTGQWEFG